MNNPEHRNRAHVAMFSIAAHGHVNPSLEVIRELVARGHRVTYAIPHLFEEKIAETGAEPVLYRTTLPGPDDDPAAWGTTLLDNVEPFLNDAIQALPQLIEAYEGDGGAGVPDLVIHDISSYPAGVLAHRWGVPAITLSPNLVAWEGYDEEVAKPMWAEPRQTPRGKAYFEKFDAWLKEYGVPKSVDDFWGRYDRTLVLIPKALQPNADRVDERKNTFVGACQGDRGAQGGWERPAGAERVALVSLGSSFTKQPDFYREFTARLGVDLTGWPDQDDRAAWPRLRELIAAALAACPQAEWAAIFAGTDACVTPVLTFEEAARHPHNAQRGVFDRLDGVLHPAPAPRFSRTPARRPATPASGPVDVARLVESWCSRDRYPEDEPARS